VPITFRHSRSAPLSKQIELTLRAGATGHRTWLWPLLPGAVRVLFFWLITVWKDRRAPLDPQFSRSLRPIFSFAVCVCVWVVFEKSIRFCWQNSNLNPLTTQCQCRVFYFIWNLKLTNEYMIAEVPENSVYSI